MATRTRKPAPSRTMTYDPETDTLCLYRGTEGTAFWLHELPAVEGGRRTFRLGKYDLSEKYTVSVIHGHAECDCPAGTYREDCRHMTAVLTLVQLGKL